MPEKCRMALHAMQSNSIRFGVKLKNGRSFFFLVNGWLKV